MGKRLPAGIGMRRHAHQVHHHAHAHVGAPAGFAPIFPGWNVWEIDQADDPVLGVLGTIWTAGESAERMLRIWVEDQIKDNAPGAAVADPANPAALKGDQVQLIPPVQGLDVAAARGDIAALAGPQQLGSKDSKVTLRTVRFYNRGTNSVLPWPHDENFLLERVFTPSADNAVTNAAPPSSLAGSATAAAEAAGTAVKAIAIGAGVVLGVVLIVSLINSSKKAAA